MMCKCGYTMISKGTYMYVCPNCNDIQSFGLCEEMGAQDREIYDREWIRFYRDKIDYYLNKIKEIENK